VPVKSGTSLVAENTSVVVACGTPTAAGEPNWFPSLPLLLAAAELWLESTSELFSWEAFNDTSPSLNDASSVSPSLSIMSSASHLHVIVTVGVLPPSEVRVAVLAPALLGVHLLHESTGAGAALLDEAAPRGVAAALDELFAADAAVGRVRDDSGGLGVLLEADADGTATLGVGLTTPPEAGVAEGATFSSVAAAPPLAPASAAATEALEISLVGSFVKPAGRAGRKGAGCWRAATIRTNTHRRRHTDSPLVCEYPGSKQGAPTRLPMQARRWRVL
jgi:hypothetical protein